MILVTSAANVNDDPAECLIEFNEVLRGAVSRSTTACIFSGVGARSGGVAVVMPSIKSTRNPRAKDPI